MIDDSNSPLSPALGPVEARSAGTGSRTGEPDPEVVARPKRRQFTAAYRLRILEEADSCTKPGEVGQLLRREGLYGSHLTAWRKAQREGALRGLASKKRGAKPRDRNPLEAKVQQLEAENARLKAELHKVHTILDVQEKVAGLLGFDLESGKSS
jgi:transposase